MPHEKVKEYGKIALDSIKYATHPIYNQKHSLGTYISWLYSAWSLQSSNLNLDMRSLLKTVLQALYSRVFITKIQYKETKQAASSKHILGRE